MADFGFWNLARSEPNRLALVDPDGREWTRGELLARRNRLVHGLRALGLQQGRLRRDRAAERRAR